VREYAAVPSVHRVAGAVSEESNSVLDSDGEMQAILRLATLTLAKSALVPYYQILTMYTSLRIGALTRNDLAGLSLLLPPDALTGPALS
jgi:hypothetical protein